MCERSPESLLNFYNRMKNTKTPAPPSHLSDSSKRWWRHICRTWVIEEQNLRLLKLCAEAYDTGELGREALAKHGLTYTDRWGAVHARPEVAIVASSRVAVARLLREMNLADTGPDAPRPPALKY